jgi:hypothetical protein
MTLDLSTYTALKRAVESDTAANNRAIGACDQLQQRLLKEHSCKGSEDGETKLARLKRKMEKAEAAFTKELEKIEKEYGDRLGEAK